MSDNYSYFMYDGIACRVLSEDDGSCISAEGYFVGEGFCPVSVSPVLYEGERLTEREFKGIVAKHIAAAPKT